MSHFIRHHALYRLLGASPEHIFDHLPAGNYTVHLDPMTGFYLERVSPFVLPAKRYGENDAKAARILETFARRELSTGVLLSGEKGSGKTLLAKTIADMAAQQSGIPTLIINRAYSGDHFNTFIQQIDQPCILFFDEFEKVYKKDDHEQEALLTLLDGTFPSKKLFLLTSNDKYGLISQMRNRPGRLFYALEFHGIESDFATEYCLDALGDQRHTAMLARMVNAWPGFNFDMLKALVEEMNRYGESPQQALRMLNIRPDIDQRQHYHIELLIHGESVPEDLLSDKLWAGNPMQVQAFSIDYYTGYDADGDLTGFQRQYFNGDHLAGFFEDGHIEFVNEKGGKAIMRPLSTKSRRDAAYLGYFTGFTEEIIPSPAPIRRKKVQERPTLPSTAHANGGLWT